MNLIAAVDVNWGIGRNNDLLFNIPEDLKYFKEKTLNKTVIMGFNTLLSLPKSQPLKNRRNIIMMRGGLLIEDAEIASSVEELIGLIGGNDEDAFVIGGAQIYSLLEPKCNRAYITHIFADGKAAVFFPNLEKMPEWKLVSESPVQRSGDIRYTFCVYERVKRLEGFAANPRTMLNEGKGEESEPIILPQIKKRKSKKLDLNNISDELSKREN